MKKAKPETKNAKSSKSSKSSKRLLEPILHLRLYITDQTPKSVEAISNLKKFCKANLKDRYRIKIIDLLKQPHLAKGDQILAIPTLVRRLPKPIRTIVGNLMDTSRIFVGLDLRAKG